LIIRELVTPTATGAAMGQFKLMRPDRLMGKGHLIQQVKQLKPKMFKYWNNRFRRCRTMVAKKLRIITGYIVSIILHEYCM
jgi:hypothetical protein